MLKTGDIIPNPYQIRRTFEQKDLESLAESLKAVGMISPLIVRRTESGYELICGQRRHRAAIIAGMNEVPAIIVRAGDVQCAELSIIENIHRKNIGVFEEAEGFYNLMMYHKVKKEKLQYDLSVDIPRISEKVQYLSLNTDSKTKLEASGTDEKYIKQILRLHSDAERIILINKILNDKLSFNDVENYVNDSLKVKISAGDEKADKRKPPKDKSLLYDNTVRKTVELLKKHGAKVEFSQKNEDEYVEYCIKTLK